MRAPLKRYYLKSILPGLLCVGLTIAAYLMAPSMPSQAAKAGLAVLPLAPLAWIFWLYFRYLGECDEMIRRIELEAIGLASLIVGLLFLSVGFLIQAGVFTVGGGTVAIWVFPSLCGIYGLTKWQAVRRYR